MNRLSDLCTISGTGGRVELTRGGRIVLVADRSPTGTDDATAHDSVIGDVADAAADSGGPGAAVERLLSLGHTDVVVVERTDEVATMAFRGDVVVGWIVDGVERFTRPVALDRVNSCQVPVGAVEVAVALGSTVPARDQSLEMTRVDATASAAAASPAGRVHLDLTARPDDRPLPPPPPPAAPATSPPAASAPPPPAPVVARAPEPPPATSAAPAVPDGVELVNLTISAPAGTPLPVGGAARPPDVQVLGIRCPLDHHNHPDAEYCSSCGRKMGVNATAVLVQGPRPPVGLLLTRSGEAIPLAGDLLVGREPTSHEDVIAGRATPVHIDDQTHVVSRHHARITLDGWDVHVRDLGSANGTIIVSGRTGLERRLSADENVPADADDEIRLGEHSLRLALHHVARR